MSARPWPKVKAIASTRVVAYAWDGPVTVVERPAIEFAEDLCRHGGGSCESCGVTDRRDFPHRTVGGRGAVGRLRS
jgi:hypothetical protein